MSEAEVPPLDDGTFAPLVISTRSHAWMTQEVMMRLWSMIFLAIAVLAAVISFRDDGEGITIARALFGMTLVLFTALLLISHRNDDGRPDH